MKNKCIFAFSKVTAKNGWFKAVHFFSNIAEYRIFLYLLKIITMKNILITLSIIFSVASCSFVKDVQSHCTVSQKEPVSIDGSFEYCLKCDSLANVVKSQIAKASKK